MPERGDGRGGWGNLWLLLGALHLAFAVGLLVLSFDPTFAWGQEHERRPLRLLTALLGGGGLLWLIAALVALRRPPSMAWVLGVGIVARVIVLFSGPMQEDDFYRYIWDGRVVLSGGDPYRFTPDEVRGQLRSPATDATQELRASAELAQQSDGLREILRRVNHGEYHSIYPPVLQGVFAVHAAVVPPEASPRSQFVAWKTIVLAFDLLTWLGVCTLLRHAGLTLSLSLLYGWCPLLLKEFTNSGHLDAVPACFLVWSLVFLEHAGSSGWRSGALAGSALALAIGAKVYAVVVLPLCLLRSAGRGRFSFSLACLLLLAASWLVFADTLGNRSHTLQVFALYWENNACLYPYVESAAARIFGEADLQVPIAGESYAIERSRVIARLACAALLAVVTLWIAVRARGAAAPLEFLRAVFRTLAALFLLSPLGFPWYFAWCVPFLAFARYRAWLLLPGLLSLYYLDFWYEYHWPEGEGAEIFKSLVRTVEYAPFVVVLAIEAFVRRQRKPARITPRDR